MVTVGARPRRGDRSIHCEDDRAAAERWVVSVFEATARLESFPRSGRAVPEVGAADVREVIFGSYRVIYSVGEQIEILAIFHGR